MSTIARATSVLLVLSLLATVPSSVLAESNAVLPPPLPPVPQQDRNDGNKAAQAAAIAAAALAAASCAMMMDAARQEPDPAQKRMMMAMALQQCAQAAMNAANAAQNKKNGEKYQDPAAPPPPPPAVAQAPPPPPPQLQMPESSPKEEEEDPIAMPIAQTNSGVVEEAAFEPKPVLAAATQVPAKDATPVVTELMPIPEAKVGFDDKAQNTSGPGGFGSFGTQSATGPTNASDLKDGAAALDTKGGKGGRRGGNHDGGEDGGEGGGGGEGEKKDGAAPNDPAMDAMLAQLLGGGAAAAGESGGGSRRDIVQLGSGSAGGAVTGEELPNIFQYASFRYKKAAEDKLIVPPAKRKIASSVTAAAIGSPP